MRCTPLILIAGLALSAAAHADTPTPEDAARSEQARLSAKLDRAQQQLSAQQQRLAEQERQLDALNAALEHAQRRAAVSAPSTD